MTETRWDAELRKIDQAIERASDNAIFPIPGGPEPGARERALTQQRTTSTWGVFLRLSLSVALGVGMIFWPYAARCGVGLAGYLAAVLVLLVSGVWSAVWTWRHQTGRAHLLSLLLVLWGLILAAIDVLPRVGYARPTPAHPATWSCPS